MVSRDLKSMEFTMIQPGSVNLKYFGLKKNDQLHIWNRFLLVYRFGCCGMGNVCIQAAGKSETGIDHCNSWDYGNPMLTFIEPGQL